jgi:hypothetical protein
MMLTPLWMKIIAIIVFLIPLWFAVIEPAMDCYAKNGTPIRGLFMIECIK